MSDDIKRAGLELLKTPEGAAFARQVLEDGTLVDAAARDRILEALEFPESLNDPEFVDSYTEAFVGSRLIFDWRSYSSTVPVSFDDFVKATMVFDGVIKIDSPQGAVPEVEKLPDGRAVFDARSFSFVTNLYKYLDERSSHEVVDQYFAYLDVDKQIFTVAPTAELAKGQADDLLSFGGGIRHARVLPLVVDYHSRGDAIMIFAHRSDGRGLALTEDGFRSAVEALRETFAPFTAIFPHEYWGHPNPTLNPFEMPFGYDPFVFIQDDNGDEAEALDFEPFMIAGAEERAASEVSVVANWKRIGGIARSSGPAKEHGFPGASLLLEDGASGEETIAGAKALGGVVGHSAAAGISASNQTLIKAGK